MNSRSFFKRAFSSFKEAHSSKAFLSWSSKSLELSVGMIP